MAAEWPHVFWTVPLSRSGDSGIGLLVALPVLIVWGAVALSELYFEVGVPGVLAWWVGIAAGVFAVAVAWTFSGYAASAGFGYFVLWGYWCVGAVAASAFVVLTTRSASREA